MAKLPNTIELEFKGAVIPVKAAARYVLRLGEVPSPTASMAIEDAWKEFWLPEKAPKLFFLGPEDQLFAISDQEAEPA